MEENTDSKLNNDAKLTNVGSNLQELSNHLD